MHAHYRKKYRNTITGNKINGVSVVAGLTTLSLRVYLPTMCILFFISSRLGFLKTFHVYFFHIEIQKNTFFAKQLFQLFIVSRILIFRDTIPIFFDVQNFLRLELTFLNFSYVRNVQKKIHHLDLRISWSSNICHRSYSMERVKSCTMHAYLLQTCRP